MDKDIQEIMEIYNRLPPEDKRLFNDLVEAVYRMTGEDAQMIRQFMEATHGLPFDFERDVMRTVIAAADGEPAAWAIIRATVLHAEIPPEEQEAVQKFTQLLQEARA